MSTLTRLFALTAIVAAPLRGQTSISVLAGGSSSNWKYSTGCQDCQHLLTNVAAGASLTVPIGHRFALAPELLYVEKGSSLDFPSNIRIAIRVHYVEGSALLRYSLPRAGKLRPFLIAGPEFAVKAACSAKLSYDPALHVDGFTEPCTTGGGNITEDEPDNVDYGVIFGAGAAFRRFALSVRYDLGLIDVFSRYHTGGGTVKDRTWLALIAVRL
jgi:hypothetical protein